MTKFFIKKFIQVNENRDDNVLEFFGIRLALPIMRPRKKKSIFSADFSAKNRFSVVLEKIFG